MAQKALKFLKECFPYSTLPVSGQGNSQAIIMSGKAYLLLNKLQKKLIS